MNGSNNTAAILSYYTESQLKNFPNMEVSEWPDVFKQWVNMNLSFMLLQDWLQNHSDSEYKTKVAELISVLLTQS